MTVGVDRPPPPVSQERGGGDQSWVELLKASDDIEAHLLGGRLLEAGIEARNVKDRSGPAWMYGGSNPWAPVTILVRRAELEAARLVLAEISWSAPAYEANGTFSLQHPNGHNDPLTGERAIEGRRRDVCHA